MPACASSVDATDAVRGDGRAKGRIRQLNEAGILRAAERVFARAGYAGATMAEIATCAGMAKSNLHYYFGTKREIYRAVLTHILALWLAPTDGICVERDPKSALGEYIDAKMRLSASHPDASRVFANEILHGAPEIGDVLRGELRALIEAKAEVIRHWIAMGRMAPVDPQHLFFTIWAATQTYADFDAQVCAVLDVPALDGEGMRRAAEHVKGLVLRGCGL
ncbi:TetR/AcrR family transcriptional regulator [Noviherbaspirillum pedocola]|uniref:TetR family transcriptional regulator C-terminal domain-containing protein n=1 Tax=Noviherbaspirillum pedocola TaxID=2801341 RepID=A0A934SWK2_9BURK|nr:TetR/AcrR family transcriptional regulator [Noviherbaspirillum pedocola]MBK4734024.1 TetR family transcriptional regulator C-terminal domain-containing protein [Noviherbaspirillum pedocola]